MKSLQLCSTIIVSKTCFAKWVVKTKLILVFNTCLTVSLDFTNNYHLQFRNSSNIDRRFQVKKARFARKSRITWKCTSYFGYIVAMLYRNQQQFFSFYYTLMQKSGVLSLTGIFVHPFLSKSIVEVSLRQR